MYLYGIDVEILVNGKPVKKYSHNGRTFIQANRGSSYSIRIKNNDHKRHLFVCSVDGINVIDGKAAGASTAGYVINGYSSYEVQGFRTSNDNVNAFKFSEKSKSYAAKSDETNGDISNCGAIGVQVYDEKEKPIPQITIIEKIIEREQRPWTYPNNPIIPNNPFNNPIITWTSNLAGGTLTSAGTPMTFAANNSMNTEDFGTLKCCNYHHVDAEIKQDSFDIGTEFSDVSLTDKVTDTEFEIGLLLSTIEVYYASRNGLQSMGVPIVKETQVSFPKPFPTNFCKPPRK